MSDLRSILGYRRDSPYKNAPSNNIFSKDGTIDMSATDIDLLGMDEYGNRKIMKAGRKQQYQFPGSQITEIPLEMKKGGLSPEKAHEMLKDGTAHGHKLTAKQKKYFGYIYGKSKKKEEGGFVNPYQKGGYSQEDLFNFLFEEDQPQDAPTAPTTNDVEVGTQEIDRQQQQMADEEQYNQALMMAMQNGENPFQKTFQNKTISGVNPYVSQTGHDLLEIPGLSNLGVWGDKAHQQRQSDHNTGDAQDFGFTDPAIADETVSKLQQEAKKRNIKYIIYNGRIWNPSISQDWRPYQGPDPHNTHFHVSYNK